MKHAGLPLRLRLQLPEQRLGPDADLRPPAGDDLAGARRRGRLAADRHPGRDHLAPSSAARSLDRVAMGGALVAISAPVYWLGLVSLYLFSNDIGSVPIFDGRRQLRARLCDDPDQWFTSLILPWIVLAASFAAIYARFLRAQPDRGDGRGLHPHRARQGPARAPRDLPPRRALGDHADRHRSSASTSASCSAARSSPRRSSTSRASAASPSTRSRRATCPIDPGHRPHRRVLHHHAEPDRRHPLRVPRPAREVLSMALLEVNDLRSTSTPTTASSRPSTASPTRSTRARRWASSASPARASPCRR